MVLERIKSFNPEVPELENLPCQVLTDLIPLCSKVLICKGK